MRKHTLIVALLSAVAVASTSKAAVTVTGKAGTAASAVDAILSTDLLNGLAPTFSYAVANTTNTTNLFTLTDASSTTAFRADVANSADAGTPYTLTWALDTSSAPLGYNLTELRLFSQADNGLVFQSYDIEVKTLGSSTFTKLNTDPIVYPDSVRGVSKEDTFFGATGAKFVETSVGIAASAVSEIRLTLYPVTNVFGATDGPFTSLATSTKGTLIYNVDLLGTVNTTPIPEPSSAVLLVATGSLFAALLRRRHK